MVEIIPLPTVKSRPLFESEAAYQKFRESFIAEVAPDMEKWRLARLKSEQESMFRIVD